MATALTAFFSGLTLNLQGPELRCADIPLGIPEGLLMLSCFRTAPGLHKTHTCTLLCLGVLLDFSPVIAMIGEVAKLAVYCR